jgi:hypothetical protein
VPAVTALAVAGAAGGGASAAAAVAAPPAPGTISTVAGGVGGPAKATNVPITDPCGVSVANGLLYIADNTTVRQVDSTDRLTTPAGTGASAPLGDGGPAASASVGTCATAVDGAGNLVLADAYRIRVVAAHNGTFYGQAMTAGDIYTIAGTGAVGHFGDGGPASIATLDKPQGVAIDPAGNVLIADSRSNRIRVVAETTGTFYGQSMNAGFIYTVAGGGTAGTGNGIPATSATLGFANGVTVDGSGNLVIATSKQRVRVVAVTTGTFYGQAMTAGDIYTVAGSGGSGFAGDGGPATKAHVVNPQSVTVDPQGNLVIADSGNSRIRVVAATSGTFYGQAMTAGDIYTVAGGGTGGLGDGGPATSAQLTGPWGATLDPSGNLVIADTGDGLIRVVAETTNTFYSQAMTAGDIYTVAGNGSVGFSGDGGPATSASLSGPEAVITDPASDVLISDTGNGRVREVAG